MCKLSLNQNLTKWNPADDYLYVNKNGVWEKTILRAGLNGLQIYHNGEGNLRAYNYAGWSRDSTYCYINNSEGALKFKSMIRTTFYYSDGLGTTEKIDFSLYSYLKYKMDGVEYTVDIRNRTTTKYLSLIVSSNTGDGVYCKFCISDGLDVSQSGSAVIEQVKGIQTTTAGAYIQGNITDIWLV